MRASFGRSKRNYQKKLSVQLSFVTTPLSSANGYRMSGNASMYQFIFKIDGNSQNDIASSFLVFGLPPFLVA